MDLLSAVLTAVTAIVATLLTISASSFVLLRYGVGPFAIFGSIAGVMLVTLGLLCWLMPGEKGAGA